MAKTATPRRSRARRGEGDKLREEILDAAERLLIQTGDEDAVSIRAVAEAVGVTPPSIYLHFSDKAELIFAVCEKHFAELDRVSQEAAAGIDDPVQALMMRGRAYIRFGLEHPEQYRILFMSKKSAIPDRFSDERMKDMAAFNHLIEAVTACVDKGVVAGDPVMVGMTCWAAAHGITSLLITKPDFPWPNHDELIDQVLTNVMFGVTRSS